MTKVIKNKGFTLAEVLITLLIIGVVASIIIPNLINDSKKAEYVTKLQKEYAVLQQAYKLIILDAGGSILNNPNFNCSGTIAFCQSAASANAMNDFAAKLNVTKNCGNTLGCWYNSLFRTLGNNTVYTNLDTSWGVTYGKAILADGTMIMIKIYNTNCSTTEGSAPIGSPLNQSVCGDVQIDINGSISPNQIGRDYFYFWITKTGLYPWGTYNDGHNCVDIYGYGCTAKVLSEGAMNY